ncbi:MAG: glycosyltransferase family 39 protein [Candidatus Andersenbacteria bacterium]
MISVDRIYRLYRAHKVNIWIVLGLLLIAAIPRLLDLGAFLTADEKNWMTRSYEFIRAFQDGRYNDMLQTTHPGVTTLWMSGIAITVKAALSGISFSQEHIIHFVKAAQFPIALVNTLAVPAIYILLRRLLVPQVVAGLAGIFIALNPFLIGYSRVAHVDALLASFLVLAALAVIIYAREQYSRTWLVISAALAAAAILTKIPAIFIIPFWVLVVLVYEGKNVLSRSMLVARGKDLGIWLGVIALLIVVTWPALVFVPNPKGNALLVKRDISIAAATPHHMAEEYTLNAWHYPAALLTRTTPITLVFSVLAMAYIFWRIKKEGLAARGNRPVFLLIMFVFFFIIMMTLGAKKGDRYILPVYPVLDILAASGLLGIGRMFAKRWRQLPIVLAVIVVVYLAGVVWRYHPYEIAYSNPLFPDNVSQETGWGEGLEQVGAWLSQEHPNATVASWYSQELQAYTTVEVLDYSAHEHPKTEFVVIYNNMFGRAKDHPASGLVEQYYSKRDPVFVARVAGREYAWVYAQRSYDRHIGELTPGVRVGQKLVADSPIAGVDVLIPTFSGKATTGTLVVEVKGDVRGAVLHRWETPVAQIGNDEWMTLLLPEALDRDTIFVEVYATGTREGNAPTIRYTIEHDYRDSSLVFSESGRLTAEDAGEGDLALRLRYLVEDQVVTEEESRLL